MAIPQKSGLPGCGGALYFIVHVAALFSFPAREKNFIISVLVFAYFSKPYGQYVLQLSAAVYSHFLTQ